MTERTDTPSTANLDERYLERVSALIDGEFDSDSLLATVDFLVRSKEARAFYLESRELDGLLEGAGKRTSASPGARVDTRIWSGIKQAVESDGSITAQSDLGKRDLDPIDLEQVRARRETERESDTPKSHPLWLLAAAVFAAVLGLASYELWQDRGASSRADSGVQVASLSQEVEVGGSPESMNDQRFFDLATELLEADRKYRKEMLALMTAVADEPLVEESTEETPDEVILRGGEANFGEADEDDRRRVEVNFW